MKKGDQEEEEEKREEETEEEEEEEITNAKFIEETHPQRPTTNPFHSIPK